MSKLTPAQLLIPRVLCIGTEEGEPIYPFSHLYSSKFVTGGVVTLSEVGVLGNCFITNDKVEWYMKRFLLFPNLFRPMPWYEGRKPDEMPEYLKHIGSGKIRKIEKFYYKGIEVAVKFERGRVHLLDNELVPATEAEYLEYQKSKR